MGVLVAILAVMMALVIVGFGTVLVTSLVGPELRSAQRRGHAVLETLRTTDA